MIDPLPQSEPALRDLCERDPRFRYLLVAVGAEAGETTINVPPDPDSSSLLGDARPRPGPPPAGADRDGRPAGRRRPGPAAAAGQAGRAGVRAERAGRRRPNCSTRPRCSSSRPTCSSSCPAARGCTSWWRTSPGGGSTRSTSPARSAARSKMTSARSTSSSSAAPARWCRATGGGTNRRSSRCCRRPSRRLRYPEDPDRRPTCPAPHRVRHPLHPRPPSRPPSPACWTSLDAQTDAGLRAGDRRQRLRAAARPCPAGRVDRRARTRPDRRPVRRHRRHRPASCWSSSTTTTSSPPTTSSRPGGSRRPSRGSACSAASPRPRWRRPSARWKRPVLPYLGIRDHGPAADHGLRRPLGRVGADRGRHGRPPGRGRAVRADGPASSADARRLGRARARPCSAGRTRSWPGPPTAWDSPARTSRRWC